MVGRLVLAVVMAVGPVPMVAQAQDGSVFYPPAGCTGALTIQMRSCRVANIYTCAADAPGENWKLVLEADGPVFLSKIDRETQWLESYDLFPTQHNVLRLPADDPANLTELLETGIDTFDFVQKMDERIVRVVGYDRLTGDDVIIDGEPLLGTEFSARYEDFEGTYLTVTGREYVSVRHRRFIGGVTTRMQDGREVERDYTPIDFIYPDEPGFFSKTPLYDCEASLARYVPTVKGNDQ
ncbi:hypothetical protein [uncultured Tateyamaria sp.]|uniref:hypothetical protein n=1 Tax=uncultured Tateyamaria sp. TaxID=455651 RepID=UPI002625A3B8|nr:hypothetical protein [uncultured Tateyamaria sp.]